MVKEEKIIFKDPKDLKPDPDNPRKGFIDEEELKGMASTFKFHSVIQPIEIDEKNQIIIGELRWRASKLAELKEIPCIIRKGLTFEQKLERQLIENFHRQNVNIGECRSELRRLLGTIQPSKYSGKDKEPIGILAERLGVNRTWLNEILQVEKEAPKQLKKEIDKYYETKGKKGVSVTQAVEIIKAPKIIREDLTNRAKEGLDSKRIRKLKKKYEDKEITLKEIRKPIGTEHIPDNLNFREEHIDMILKGKKIQTTRYWSNLKVGDKTSINLFEPDVAKIEIIDNETKKLKDFTEDDAKREGGYTLKEFKEVWKKIHGKWKPETEVKAYKFKLLK